MIATRRDKEKNPPMKSNKEYGARGTPLERWEKENVEQQALSKEEQAIDMAILTGNKWVVDHRTGELKEAPSRFEGIRNNLKIFQYFRNKHMELLELKGEHVQAAMAGLPNPDSQYEYFRALVANYGYDGDDFRHHLKNYAVKLRQAYNSYLLMVENYNDEAAEQKAERQFGAMVNKRKDIEYLLIYGGLK
jgi:hypothetical protein